MRVKTLPIFLAFFLMGLADAMGPMSDGVKKQYELSNLVATLLPFFVFIAFAIFSIPGGLLAARIGKKKLLLLGLGLNAAALLLPSLQMPSFALLLGVHLRPRRRHDFPSGSRQSHHARCESRGRI